MVYLIGIINTRFTDQQMFQSYQDATKPVETVNNEKVTKYPFSTITLTTSNQSEYVFDNVSHTFDSQSNMIVMSNNEHPQMIVQIDAYGDTRQNAFGLANDIKNFLDFGADLIITDVAIVESGDVREVALLIIDEYEYRYTFDVTVRYAETTTYNVENINMVTLERGGN